MIAFCEAFPWQSNFPSLPDVSFGEGKSLRINNNVADLRDFVRNAFRKNFRSEKLPRLMYLITLGFQSTTFSHLRGS